MRGHLRVAIAPSAELEAAAHPAQTLGGIRSAFFAADRAAAGLLEAVGFDRALGLLEQAIAQALDEAGLKPGPDMKRILEAAFEAQLDGAFGDEAGAIAWAENFVREKSKG